MAAEAKKPKITYAGVELAANSAIAWRYTTGTRPHSATFSVHKRIWEQKLEKLLGKEGDLVIVDSRGKTHTVRKLTLLHQAPSDGPNRVAFVVADRRWRWPYVLVARDFNVPRKTGDRTAVLNVPQVGFLSRDEYDFKTFSLEGGEDVWTARLALEDVLDQVTDYKGRVEFSSFPINESNSSGDREFTMQNVVLRDQGDVAVSRLLANIPGATLWVDPEGVVKVINGADLAATEAYFKNLPGATWDGEKAIVVERKHIRPSKAIIHYQRELELLLEYEDDYSGNTQTQPSFRRPYIENVIQTVDDKTTVTEYDPIARTMVEKKDLPPGTWVEFKAWLAAMDKIKPANSSEPWTFETIKKLWILGSLDAALGAGGVRDVDEEANVSMRVQAIKQHFRQSFRINRLITDKTRDLMNVRVGILDPVTGMRAPSSVWGQACIIPTQKGKFTPRKADGGKADGRYYRNVDYLAASKDSNRIIKTPPGPTRVNMIDRDLGIFRLDWIVSPYGTDESFIPCLLDDSSTGVPGVPTRDMAQQEKKPVSAGVQISQKTLSIWLSDSLEYKIMLSFVPGAPNSKRAFHTEEITGADVEKFVEGDWRIGEGVGPVLEVFVEPSEMTARFAWEKDKEATATIDKLLGLGEKDPVEAGIEGNELDGFQIINRNPELWSHSRSTAAEYYAAFADSLQGRVATVMPANGIDLVGNMAGVTVQAAAAPSGKVSVMHDFPGVQKPISRLALMNNAARQLVLGIVRFRGET